MTQSADQLQSLIHIIWHQKQGEPFMYRALYITRVILWSSCIQKINQQKYWPWKSATVQRVQAAHHCIVMKWLLLITSSDSVIILWQISVQNHRRNMIHYTKQCLPLDASVLWGLPVTSVKSFCHASLTADLKTLLCSRSCGGRKLFLRYSTDLTWSCCSVVKME